MRGLQIKTHAHPSKQHVVYDLPVPTPAPDGTEVLVDVYSAGLNFFDILQAQGKYQEQPPLPFVLGSEFAGRISADSPIPPGCPFRRGDRVFGAAQGAFGDTLCVRWSGRLVKIPEGMSFDEAAGLYITWPTSYEALAGRAQLKAGEWVLVTAAAGGVGIAAVQIAKAMGAKVVAAAGSQAKVDVALKAGADFGVDYTKAGWQKDMLKATGGHGADVVYDPVGLIQDSLKCIAWRGRAIVVGFAAGKIEKLPLNLVLLKNISIVGIHLGAYTKHWPERLGEVWDEIFALFKSGKTKPLLYPEVYSLERISEGLIAIEERKTWGKAVARIRNDDGTPFVERSQAKL